MVGVLPAKRLIKILPIALIVGALVSPTSWATPTAAQAAAVAPAATVKVSPTVLKKWKAENKKLLAKLKKAKTVKDPKKPKISPNSVVVRPAGGITRGTYSYRAGVILATADAYKNLIPTGHAALVYSDLYVVEALSSGVMLGSNNWYTTKKTAFQATVKETTAKQDTKAADWAYSKLLKPYNYNYFNTATRKKFYCSQLVWADFLDNYGVNLNTAAFKIPKLGNPVHPLELMLNSHVRLLYIHFS
jgi:uncharacterized protein YycO